MDKKITGHQKKKKPQKPPKPHPKNPHQLAVPSGAELSYRNSLSGAGGRTGCKTKTTAAAAERRGKKPSFLLGEGRGGPAGGEEARDGSPQNAKKGGVFRLGLRLCSKSSHARGGESSEGGFR